MLCFAYSLVTELHDPWKAFQLSGLLPTSSAQSKAFNLFQLFALTDAQYCSVRSLGGKLCIDPQIRWAVCCMVEKDMLPFATLFLYYNNEASH